MSLIITVMVINMQEERLDSIESLEQFLAGTAGVSAMSDRHLVEAVTQVEKMKTGRPKQ